MSLPLLPNLPVQQSLLDKMGVSTVFYSWLDTVYNIVVVLTQSGPTANRPTTRLWIGRQFFDTTLGYPVWVQSLNGSYVATWVNGAGTVV